MQVEKYNRISFMERQLSSVHQAMLVPQLCLQSYTARASLSLLRTTVLLVLLLSSQQNVVSLYLFYRFSIHTQSYKDYNP